MALIPLTITVTVPGAPLDPAEYDGQGNPLLGPDVVTTPTIKAFAPRESNETAEDFGGRSITGGTVYGYLGTEIPSNAILTIRGIDYLMEGEVGDWHPAYANSQAYGVEFAVKRAS